MGRAFSPDAVGFGFLGLRKAFAPGWYGARRWRSEPGSFAGLYAILDTKDALHVKGFNAL